MAHVGLVRSKPRIAGGWRNCLLKFSSPALASYRLPAFSSVWRRLHGGLATQELSGRRFVFAHGAWSGTLAPWLLWERRAHPLQHWVYGHLLSRALTMRLVCRA